MSKKLGSAPRDTTIYLVLTAAEVDRIYRKVAEERLFDVPELRAPTTCRWVPASSQRYARLSDECVMQEAQRLGDGRRR